MINLVKAFLLIGILLSFSKITVGQPIQFTIDLKKKVQTVDNFGASGAWFSEGIGKHWAAEKKERMAELLFSKGFDSSGNPLGIGLSAWRFNIGGGTTEQGDSSGISNPVKRVECFLAPDGSYDWSKQQGYTWFTKKAAAYGVENLIAFSNTPPVQFTKNGLGFKLEKDFKTNLREDRYGAYADFLATVIQHFDKDGIHFNYISPVNEPQWDWSNKFGQMNQEGSPWLNKDIYRVTACLDSALTARKLSAKILLPEAATLTALYEGNGHAAKQIQQFYSSASKNYMGNLRHVKPVFAGHSYFTDSGDTAIVTVRKKLRDTAEKYQVPFWQSEYSMLGDGYREGQKGRVSGMDCALFLSKIIYHDLAIANASAWQFWNSWEPGRADANTRYYLLALKSNPANTDGDFSVTKNLWALGHFSRFIRPGMQRLKVTEGDGLNEIQRAQNIMLSAFTNNEQIVVVAINYTTTAKEMALQLEGAKKVKSMKQYLTTDSATDNLKLYPLNNLQKIILAPRSIVTMVLDMIK
ncbi:MAG: glycoside hydrolase [Bacteroidota bacterium]